MQDLERPSASDQQLLSARVSTEDILNSKGMSFGGAGVALAIILLIAQIGVGKPLLVWSLGLAATALPLWISLALSLDTWGIFKLQMEDLLALPWLQKLQNYTFCISVCLLFGSVACLLYAIPPIAAVIFAVFSIVGFFLVCAAVLGGVRRLRQRARNAAL